MKAQLNELEGGEEAGRECPNCHSKRIVKDGTRETNVGSIQRYLCKNKRCNFRFSEKSYKEYCLSGNSQLCAELEAKKLDSATETKTVAGESAKCNATQTDIEGKIIDFL